MSVFNFSTVLVDTSQAEFFVMSAINKLEDIQENDRNGVVKIADRLHVSSPAVSRTITALEKRGYAERYIDKDDRRSTGVRLTSLGEKVYSDECDRLYAFTEGVLKKMGEVKVNMLVNLSNELFVTVAEELRTQEHNGKMQF